MRGRGACGLFGDWQSKTFSEILEENKGCNPTGVCQSCGTSFGKVADCSTACINAGVDPEILARRFHDRSGPSEKFDFFPKTGKEFWTPPNSSSGYRRACQNFRNKECQIFRNRQL